MAVVATQAVCKMRGGSESQLMLDSDQCFWVVKFQNNSQHPRILVNEWIATRLAESIGLSVPPIDIVEVDPWLTRKSPSMRYEGFSQDRTEYASGLQFGSKMLCGAYDFLPESFLAQVSNVDEFAGVLCLDRWTCNTDGRQVMFKRLGKRGNFRAFFIDQGFCFNAGAWNFPTTPTRGVYGSNVVYAKVTGWESFEPWLSRLEAVTLDTLWTIAKEVPLEWYGADEAALGQLFSRLMRRQSKIRDLILEFRNSDRVPFPNWL